MEKGFVFAVYCFMVHCFPPLSYCITPLAKEAPVLTVLNYTCA